MSDNKIALEEDGKRYQKNIQNAEMSLGSKDTLDTNVSNLYVEVETNDIFVPSPPALINEYDLPSADSEYYYEKPYLIRCLGEITLSRSSLLKNPFFVYPEISDPGTYQALWQEAIPVKYDDIGVERYKDLCKKYASNTSRRVELRLSTSELNMRFYAFHKRGVRAVLETLADNVCVNKCDLNNTWMEPIVGTYISEMLDKNRTLTTLILHECRLGPEGIKNLSLGIKQTKMLEELDLSNNNITNEGMQYLGPAIQVNDSIHTLNLSRNGITFDAGDCIGDMFLNNTVLQNLDLSWNYFNNVKGMKVMMEGLRFNIQTKIGNLNFAWCGFSGNSVGPIMLLLYENKSIMSLDLSYNRIQDQAAEYIFNGCEKTKVLKELILTGNPLTDEDLEKFITFLAQKKTPIMLLDIRYNSLDSKHRESLERINKRGKAVLFRGYYHDYVIIGPNYKELLLRRCKTIVDESNKKGKGKKKKIEFGTFFYEAGDEPISKNVFREMIDGIKCAKLSKDEPLLKELIAQFENEKKKIIIHEMRDIFLRMFPDTRRPPPPPLPPPPPPPPVEPVPQPTKPSKKKKK